VFRRFVTRDFEQMRRSMYAVFFQLPWLPEQAMRAGNWHTAVRALRGSAKPGTFTEEDIAKYKEAWSQPGAMTAMLNWYRAVRYQEILPKQMQIKVPTLMMWGMKDVALTHRMARPSIDHCDDGRLVLFPDHSHWVQHEAAEEVNQYLIDFFLDKISKQAIR
jgi:pimeloyl-ACP methyl ester carboxylesterase